MSPAEIERSALLLPIEDRLRVARLLVESVSDSEVEQASIDEGVRRLEEMVTGKVVGIPLDEFLRQLK